jgi:subtilisin family serine protease
MNRVLLIATIVLAAIAASSASMRNDPGYNGGVIDEMITRRLQTQKTVDIFVKIWGDADLTAVHTLNTEARAAATFEVLSTFSSLRQKSLVSLLASRGIEYESFWIINAVYIRDASDALIQELAQREDVEVIRGDREAQLHLPVVVEESTNSTTAEAYIQLIGATRAWARGYTGQNVVVANIDTGVRGTHSALAGNYRGGAYSWFDPRGTSATPSDTNGHGTHTMGTIAGSAASGVGVAYGSKWISARGCASSSCSSYDLTASAQWVACPNSPSCTQKPHLVNNSWGGGQGDTWYLSYINAWRAANILPVFSAGNSGSACSTANSPGDNSGAFSVGASDTADRIASFSSRGPGRLVTQKPEISAPGVSVNSAYSTSDTAYARLSGTSMAAPHIAGAAALLISARPGVAIAEIERVFISTTFKGMAQPTSGATSCGGVAYNTYPNYIYGYGRIQVDAAIGVLTGQAL